MSVLEGAFAYSSRAPFPSTHAPIKAEAPTEFSAAVILLPRYQSLLSTLPDDGVEVALLTEVPTPEGGNISEPTDKAYRRQSVSFVAARPGSAQRNRTRIVFDFSAIEAPNVKCVGVFVDGKLHFYGRLERAAVQPGCTSESGSQICIGPESLVLSFRRPS